MDDEIKQVRVLFWLYNGIRLVKALNQSAYRSASRGAGYTSG